MLLGIPIVQAAYGEEGMVFLIVIIAIHTPVMMLASILLNEWALAAGEGATGAASRTETLQRLATLLFTNPIFLGIVIGGLWRLAGFGIPGVLAAIIEPLARSAGPLALFAAGMALMKFGMARQIAPAAVISALKLLVMPALVFLVAHAIGLPPLGIAVVTLTAACPTGVSVFLIASRIGTGQALASNVLLISTAAGVGERVAVADRGESDARLRGHSPSPAMSRAGLSPAARRARSVSEPRDLESLRPAASRIRR